MGGRNVFMDSKIQDVTEKKKLKKTCKKDTTKYNFLYRNLYNWNNQDIRIYVNLKTGWITVDMEMGKYLQSFIPACLN